MNAVTEAEVQALQIRPGSLEKAELHKGLLLVPCTRLRLGRDNVRKTRGLPLASLAASILRVGLLQNLIVAPADDGWHYDVVAGGRRYAAIKLLVNKHKLPKDWDVPCLQVPDASAATMSLAGEAAGRRLELGGGGAKDDVGGTA